MQDLFPLKKIKFQIKCCDPLHYTRFEEIGWTTILGTLEINISLDYEKKLEGYYCMACAKYL
jgi:hypothetical protein